MDINNKKGNTDNKRNNKGNNDNKQNPWIKEVIK
jgi:hypothetical protein